MLHELGLEYDRKTLLAISTHYKHFLYGYEQVRAACGDAFVANPIIGRMQAGVFTTPTDENGFCDFCRVSLSVFA